MSYRLIDANAIAESFQEVNDMPCIYADLSDGLDGRLYDLRETGEMQDENARLRELIADVHEALCADKAGMFHKLILASMEYDMRELGIEVDE